MVANSLSPSSLSISFSLDSFFSLNVTIKKQNHPIHRNCNFNLSSHDQEFLCDKYLPSLIFVNIIAISFMLNVKTVFLFHIFWVFLSIRKQALNGGPFFAACASAKNIPYLKLWCRIYFLLSFFLFLGISCVFLNVFYLFFVFVIALGLSVICLSLCVCRCKCICLPVYLYLRSSRVFVRSQLCLL